MTVYDCFQFFNELDLLEIRLSELYAVVDYFVLVEARQTHDGSPKPLYYQRNRRRFARFSDKIIHVVIDLPSLNWFDRLIVKASQKGSLYKITSKIAAFGFGRMKMDHFQRRQILRGIPTIDDCDVLVISDIDEIPRVSCLHKAIELARGGKAVVLDQTHYIYFLNGLVQGNRWLGTKVCTWGYVRKHFRGDVQQVRVPIWDMVRARLFGARDRFVRIPDAGWHFTYLGGWKRVLLKRRVFAHSEVSVGDSVSAAAVKRDIERGVMSYKDDRPLRIVYVSIDKTFPRTVQKNVVRYAHLLHKPSSRSHA